MKSLLPLVILLVNIVRVTGSCEEGDDHIYSSNKVEAQRCSDDKLFYYTLRYDNKTECTGLELREENHCWWDTTVESHCLNTEECLWLDDNVLGGACYCAETTSTCDACKRKTPAPTYSGFQCPDDCKVFYVGCSLMFCNCFGGCASAQELGCIDPVFPHCHLWYTNYPSVAPTSAPKSVYWGCNLCCLEQSKIHNTTSSVARALSLPDEKVTIKSYTMVDRGGRRRTEDAEEWDIVYEITLEHGDSTEDMIDTLGDSDVLDTIAGNIDIDLDIELESIETTSLGEDDPTALSASSSRSNSMGGIIVVIICAIVGVFLLCFVGYRLYVWRNLQKYNVDTAKTTTGEFCPGDEGEMTTEGLSPGGEGEMTKEGLCPVGSGEMVAV